MRLRSFLSVVILWVLLSRSVYGQGGLNQIPTPDLYGNGQTALTYQMQSGILGSSREVLITQGFPGYEVTLEQDIAGKYRSAALQWQLFQKGSWFLSGGYKDVNTFFAVGGFYQRRTHWIFGGQVRQGHFSILTGYSYALNNTWTWQFDYISGRHDYITAGLTYNLTPKLQFNPAIFVSNDLLHSVHAYGYAALTFLP
jgi:hypothetical protein